VDVISEIESTNHHLGSTIKKLQDCTKETMQKLAVVQEAKADVESLLSNTVNDLNITKKLVKEKVADLSALSKINKNMTIQITNLNSSLDDTYKQNEELKQTIESDLLLLKSKVEEIEDFKRKVTK